VAAAVLPWALGAATRGDADADRLLAASDVLSAAPRELRAELRFASGGGKAPRTPIELWRKGDAFALVRFLAPRDLGKFVVRREGDYYLLLSDGRPPKRLARALVPAGAIALDDLLSLRPSSDYRLATRDETSGLVTYDLVAHSPSAGSPRLRWVVDRARRRPVRAELRDVEDRVARLIEFTSWRPGVEPEPATLVAKDLARGGRPLVVEILSLEAREVPAALFDLDDGSARARLPPPDDPTSP